MTDNRQIDAKSGNPVLMAESFKKITIKQCPQNLLYSIDPVDKYVELIKEYLKEIGQPVPNNVKIVISAGGATQTCTAYYYAVQKLEKKQITVSSHNHLPHYKLHEQITEIVPNCQWINNQNNADLVVIVSPNNPDGDVVKYPKVTKKQYLLLDSVFDTPMFSGSFKTINPWKYKYYDSKYFCEINSMSKLGLAGIRLGFALTSNLDIYTHMVEYIKISTRGTNTWSLKNFAINFKNDLSNKSFHENIYNELQKRHQQIRKIIPQKYIKSNTTLPFLFLSLPPSIFSRYKITVKSGIDFGLTDQYSRIQMMLSQSDWNELIRRLHMIFE